VDAFRKRNDSHLLINDLLSEGRPLASCPITVTEVYAGIRASEEKTTRAFMRSLVFPAITEDIAGHAGRLKAQYARQGRTLSFQDVSIAAVCIAYGCPLLTANVKDFPMAGLQLFPVPGIV
jgi:predicted nucleic acid-binding protein